MVRIKVRETHIRTKSRVKPDGTKHSTKRVRKYSVVVYSANQLSEESGPRSIRQIPCHWWDWRRADAVIDLLLRLLGG